MSLIVVTTQKTEVGGAPLRSNDHKTSSQAIDLRVLYGLDEGQNADQADLIVELIDLFVEDASSKLVAIKKALAGTEQTSLKRAAHNLQGSSATLGANAMAGLCKEFQRLDPGDSIEHSRTLLSRLEDEFSRVRLVFAAERQKRFS